MKKITSVTAIVLIVVTLLTSLFSVDTLAKKNVATKKTPNYKLTVKIGDIPKAEALGLPASTTTATQLKGSVD